ncbi:hypothetical protein LEMLEM_LOCUS11016 [Lemmus lemmus]
MELRALCLHDRAAGNTKVQNLEELLPTPRLCLLTKYSSQENSRQTFPQHPEQDSPSLRRLLFGDDTQGDVRDIRELC